MEGTWVGLGVGSESYFSRSAAICTIESNDSGVQTTPVSTIESNDSGVEPTAVIASMDDEQIRQMFKREDRKKDISSLTNRELAVYQLFPDMPMRSELPKFGPGRKAKSLVYTMRRLDDIVKDKANTTWKRFWYVDHDSKVHIDRRTRTNECSC
jgi:hypothetical protein